MRKMVSVLLVCLMLLLGVACSADSSESSTENNTPSTTEQDENLNTEAEEQNAPQNEPLSGADNPLLDDIVVEMEIDAALSQGIVTVTNNGSMTFSGNVSVYFENADGDPVGDDMIFVEEITPGNQGYARIDITEVDDVTMHYSISSPEFTEAPSADGGSLDEEASASLTEAFDLSFGGAGDPQMATSWYPYVAKIEVYAGETNYAIITVTADATTEAIDRIGNTIFGNYSKSFNLSRVQVVDDTGAELSDRAA